MLKRLSQRLSGGHKDKLSNDVVRFRGLSLQALFDIETRVLDDVDLADLFVVKDDSLQAVSRNGNRVNIAGLTFCLRERSGDGDLVGTIASIQDPVRLKASQAVPKKRTDWTIEDVCEYLVLPITLANGNCFYLDLIAPAAVGKPFQGAFVSQARRCRFSDLLGALKAYYKGKDLAKQFVWLDLFSANQPKLTGADSESNAEILGERYELLTHGLHAAIERFEERLIFFDSWTEPAPLARMWCVWEIFGAARSGKSLEVVFAPDASEKLTEQVVFNPDSVTDVLSRFELREAQCFRASDRQMILDAVAALPGGFANLNGQVITQLRSLMAGLARAAALRRREDSGRTTGAAEILHQVGAVLCDLDDLDGGEELLQEALSILQELLPPMHLRTAKTLHELAVLKSVRGDFKAALQLYQDVLAVYRVKQGPRDVVTGAALHEMARVQWRLGKRDAAQALFVEAYAIEWRRNGAANSLPEIKKGDKLEPPRLDCDGLLEISQEQLGPNTRTSRAALATMASALFVLGYSEEALALLRRVVALNEEKMGDKHPSTLTARHNVARALHAQGSFADAVALYGQVLAITGEQMGAEHTSTVAAMRDMAQALRATNELERARTLCERVLAIVQKQHKQGVANAALARAQADFAGVLLDLGDSKQARVLLKKALAGYEAAFGAEHPSTVAVASALK